MSFIVQPSSLASVLCVFFLFHVPCFSQRKTSSVSSNTNNQRIPGQVEFSCPEEFGYYPHPSDCTQYYVCVFGGAVLESCTGGLMYSHELQTCDWPRNVGCDGASAVYADDEPAPPPQRSKGPPPSQQSQPSRINVQSRQRDELITKPLYEEEELGPAEEIENDRQQRVYRGQPPTLGQVARDRDGIAKHANALQTSSGVKQHNPFQYRTSVAPQPQQVYLQSASPTPSYNYSSAINQFSQSQQQPQQKQSQQRAQQQFDTSYYNLYDDEFYREDDFAPQYQNQNRGKSRDQVEVQVPSQQQQQKQQINNVVQQNNLFSSQDYNEQYHLQGADQDTRYEQPTKSSLLNATSSYSVDSNKPNNPPQSRPQSYSFEQTPQPASQRSNRFTIPETRPVLKPFSFNYETPPSVNERNIFRNFESSLQRENTLPVVQLFQQDRPSRDDVESERQYLFKLGNSNRNSFISEPEKKEVRFESRDRIEQRERAEQRERNEQRERAEQRERNEQRQRAEQRERNEQRERAEQREKNEQRERAEQRERNEQRERIEPRERAEQRERNEQRDPKRISQSRGGNDVYVQGLKNPGVNGNNGNFRIVVDETSTTSRSSLGSDLRNFNPAIPTQKPRPFSVADDTYYQPSKTDYVTKVPQISQEYVNKNLNDTIKQRLNSAIIASSLKTPSESKSESSTVKLVSSLGFNIKPEEFLFDNEWKPITGKPTNSRGPRPSAAYLVESDKKGEYYLYSSESPKPGSTPKSPFEVSTEEVVIVRHTSKPEDNYRQSLQSTNIYARQTTPANSFNYQAKTAAPSNAFTRPVTQSIPTIDNSYRQFSNQHIKPTTQIYPKQNTDVKPWKFNVANKQITPEESNRQPQASTNKVSTISNVKTTFPSTARPSTTPYTPYNYIKQITSINNNEVKPSTYRQQIRSTTNAPTSSRDYKDQQIRANQVKVTADRARVLEQNLQRNTLSRNPEATKHIEPTTNRGFSIEANKFKYSKPAEVIKDNFVDSITYNNATGADSEEYYYDDFEEYEEEPVSKPSPPSSSSSSPPPTRPTTVRVKPEPVRPQSPSKADDEKCVGLECNEKPLVRVRPTTSVNQSTPIATSSRGRVRGSATYTTASPDAEKPSGGSSSSRSRPTLKPSQSIVSKAQEFIDIYKFPPSRPEPVYPTPQVDKTAAKCRKDVCLLPDCYCGGKEVPGDLTPEETPQIVLLTFDDSVNDLNKGLYADLFEKGRTNPNGCPISATFYVSHEWTDYSQVQNLYANGHEIASHTVSHSFGEQFSQKKWTREIAGQREILAAYGGVKLEDIRGMRAPFLAIGGNKMFKMLYDSNFTYDSSMPVYENRPPSWPYTLDYKIFHDCMIPPCPTRSYPGVWEVPMVMWQDLNGGRCSMGDACSNPPDADGVYKMLLKNFERHFTTNRAPFGLYYHAAWFTQPHHKEGFIAFIDTIVNMPEVWLVNNWQAIQWVRDPTPINRLNSFQPFTCDYPDRPKKCNNPKVCNLWHKSGVRYMRTCQPCPDVYPWTGLTGIRNSRVDNEIINES